MPHCCPQKQQWVFTKRSGGVEAFHPSGGSPFKCGPNSLTISVTGTGSFAMTIARSRGDVLHATTCLVRAPGSVCDTADKPADSARRSQADIRSLIDLPLS